MGVKLSPLVCRHLEEHPLVSVKSRMPYTKCTIERGAQVYMYHSKLAIQAYCDVILHGLLLICIQAYCDVILHGLLLICIQAYCDVILHGRPLKV